MLGANHTACQLFTDWEGKRTKRERNLLWFYCCDPAARSLFVDWEQEAADQLALFREAYARHPDDPSYKRVLDEMFRANPAAVGWWEQHDTDPTRGRSKRIRLDTGRSSSCGSSSSRWPTSRTSGSSATSRTSTATSTTIDV